MNDNNNCLKLDLPCDQALDWVLERISSAGLTVIRTFDLKAARQLDMLCPCPHHGMESCDCQMVVLLVYLQKQRPLTIVAHGYDDQTWFSLVNTPEQKADPRLEAVVRHLLVYPFASPINLYPSANAV